MSPRKARTSGQTRQQIAQRLRERRAREEVLILDATDALARRRAAETALAESVEALTDALAELQRYGFDLAEIAQLLDSSPTELTGTGGQRRVSTRVSAPEQPAEEP
jgi:hypothetical protein